MSKRIIRFSALAGLVLLWLGLTFVKHEGTTSVNHYIVDSVKTGIASVAGIQEDKVEGEAAKEEEKERLDAEHAAEQGISQEDPMSEEARKLLEDNSKVRATFVTLVRNSELAQMSNSIRQVEDRFNSKFHYPWVFLNDEPFTEEFKSVVKELISGDVEFGIIPEEHWSYPDWINQEKAAAAREQMAKDNIIYGGSESYRHMCRYESGFFWRHPLLDNYDWYWRVEPDIKLHCDIDYDVFQWMRDNDKEYGFTISIHEYKETIPTLWKTTKEFIKEHPEYVDKNNMRAFISDDKGKSYNLCHFWSNFEIASLNFWRSEAYRAYFDHLDHAGGFFYERWGDAPVHSIAAALFLPKDKIHYFEDIGYFHNPFNNCPIDSEVYEKGKCNCNQDYDFTFQGYSCGNKYFEVNKMTKPDGWERFIRT